MSMDLMKKDLEEFNILLDEQQINQFNKYYELLKEWNSFMNLTTIIEFDEVLKKHFVDSLSLVKVLPDLLQKDYSLIDIGTGAGFPGIPLKIVFSNLKITLLDSLNKRVRFLNEVIDQLGLENITVIHGRAEDFAKPDKLRESFEICVSRAVANLTILSEYCIPFVKKGGYFISYKSEKLRKNLIMQKMQFICLEVNLKSKMNFYFPALTYIEIFLLLRK